MHALIIEDEPLIAMDIEAALRECGFTSFDFATTADAAVIAARRKCPDVITVDVKLSPGCGITAVQSICAERPIPFLFISGSPGEVRIRMPGHVLVEKPFLARHIIDAIKLTLGGRDG